MGKTTGSSAFNFDVILSERSESKDLASLDSSASVGMTTSSLGMTKNGSRSLPPLQKLRRTSRSLAMTLIILLISTHAYASPWTERSSYAGKAFGKLGFGLKNAAFFWLHPFKEAKQPGYDNEFHGFTNGIGQSVFFMVNGLVQLVTFPIPVDVMDLGDGVTAKPRARRTIVGPEPPKKDKRLEAQEKALMEMKEQGDFLKASPAKNRGGYSIELGPSPEEIDAAMEAELARIASM